MVEFMMAADMIEMNMSRDGQDLCALEAGSKSSQAGQPCSCVDHQIPVAATNVPNVAAYQGHYMRFVDEGNITVDLVFFKPSVCNLKAGVVVTSLSHRNRS